jgi:MATE family multidrug resistance protein
MCVAAAAVAATCRPFKKYRVLGRLWHPDLPLLITLVRIGAPIGGAMLLEYGVFAAAALLIGRISESAVAAHQIALQTATILYMVPFGIALAATVRVGQAVGRGDASAVRRAGFAAMLLAVAFMGVMTVVVVLARNAIPLLFLGGSAPSSDTFVLATGLLLLATSFFIADGAQAVAAGALRGLNDTRVPLLFAALSFWMIGFASCLVLAFPLRLGAYGVWIGLALATTAYAVLLVGRFHALTSRRRLPTLIGDGRG